MCGLYSFPVRSLQELNQINRSGLRLYGSGQFAFILKLLRQNICTANGHARVTFPGPSQFRVFNATEKKQTNKLNEYR